MRFAGADDAGAAAPESDLCYVVVRQRGGPELHNLGLRAARYRDTSDAADRWKRRVASFARCDNHRVATRKASHVQLFSNHRGARRRIRVESDRAEGSLFKLFDICVC